MTKDEALVLALEALEGIYIEGFTMDDSPINNAITAIKEALAQPVQEPVQEPVAWCVTYNRELTGNIFENRRIADLCKRNLEAKYGSEESREVVPIYTTPPQRTWVGLTRDEILEARWHNKSSYKFARVLEAKLKEKNT